MRTGIYKIKFKNHPVKTTLLDGRLFVNVADLDRFLALDDLGLLNHGRRIGRHNVTRIDRETYASVPALMVVLFSELNHTNVITPGYGRIIKSVCRWLTGPHFNREVMAYVSGWTMTRGNRHRSKLLTYRRENQEIGVLDGIASNFSDQDDCYNLPLSAAHDPLERLLGVHLSAVAKLKAGFLNLYQRGEIASPFYWSQLRIRQLADFVIHGHSRLLNNGFWTYNHRTLVIYQQFLVLR